MELLAALIFGILIGLFTSRFVKPKSFGTLVVDHSDEDGPLLFVELNDRDWQSKLSKTKKVSMNVVFKDYLPRK